MGREMGVKGGKVSLRIGSVNVTSVKKSDGCQKTFDFCCLQLTGWSGEGCERGPGNFEDWLIECDINEEEGW